MILKLKTLFCLLILVVFISESCSATKRDCRGKKKHRLSNGIWM